MSTANVQVQQGDKPQPVKTGNTNEPDYVRLSNGVLMPLIGYGTFQLQDADMVKQALEVGYRHLDCASLYGNQELVGRGIASWIAADPSKNKREDLFVTSKIFNDEHRPELLRKSAEKSIAELGTKYLDLLLLHWPNAFKPGSGSSFHGDVCPAEGEKPPGCVVFDDEVTHEQTWRAMEKLVDDGLVRCIGLSNFSHKEVTHICNIARIKPTINEIELHPFLAQKEFVAWCASMGVTCLAYGPLGGPNAYLPNDLLPHPTVTKVAQEAGKTNGRILVKWSVQRGVPVLVKTGTASRLKENLWGMMDYKLTDEQMAALDSLENGKRLVTVPWKKWETEPVPDPVPSTKA
uniref:Dihydroxyacetone reductase n=1 Tax=Dunaliella salina TaxID=3046 RepID=B8Y210_DUNSA|nr:dihydroxyacetone reductase [Dunaliella salina]